MRKIAAVSLILGLGAIAFCGWKCASIGGDEMPADALPIIPRRFFRITDFGAVGDGKTLDTVAIQTAIKTCASAGGGTVIVPPGRFLTAALRLDSNINLHLQTGAVIVFSDNPDDYTLNDNGGYQNFLTANYCHDIEITGSGTIDGQGENWWKGYKADGNGGHHRPHMIVFWDCRRLRVQGVTLRDSPMEHLVPRACRDVDIEDVKILDHSFELAKNTDGIDPNGRNFLITRCTIDTGDDNIAIKPMERSDPERAACEDILISDCTFLHGHGVSIGGQTEGGMTNMVVRNCTFDGTDFGIRTKAPRTAGGLVENLVYENITMKNVGYAITFSSYYPETTAPEDLSKAESKPVTETTPIWRNIRIHHLQATGGEYAGRMLGLPEMPISGVWLEDVHISARKPLVIFDANDVHFANSTIQVERGKPLALTNAQVEGIDPDAVQ